MGRQANGPQAMKNRRRIILSAVVGAIAGYFALHPYSMLVYYLHGRHEAAEGHASFLPQATAVFTPDMLVMGIPYALLGAGAGLFFGLWLAAERRRDEADRRATAAATLRQLMVTLSHYLLNAATVIGGYSSIMLRKEQDAKFREHARIIKHESDGIEAVVKSLQSIESVAAEHYTKDSETMIIDITRDLDRRLAENAKKDAAA